LGDAVTPFVHTGRYSLDHGAITSIQRRMNFRSRGHYRIGSAGFRDEVVLMGLKRAVRSAGRMCSIGSPARWSRG